MAKKWAMVLGVVFVVVGLLGFVSNPLVGDGAIFHTDMVHNLVHLVIGLVLVYAAAKTNGSAMALKVFGVVYLVVAVIGFVSGDTVLGLIEVNAADNWLHVVLGVVLLLVGFTAKDSSPMATGNGMGQM